MKKHNYELPEQFFDIALITVRYSEAFFLSVV